jgi:hypothetical protein
MAGLLRWTCSCTRTPDSLWICLRVSCTGPCTPVRLCVFCAPVLTRVGGRFSSLFHIDNAYNFPNLRVTGFMCRTHLPTNTAYELCLASYTR